MTIKKEIRKQIYNKYNGHCAYCGCELDYKDMLVDHIKPIFHTWSEEDKEKLLSPDQIGTDDIENLNPSCRACNFRKGTESLEDFRNAIEHGLLVLERDFTYRFMKKYNLIEEHPHKVEFYFEQVDKNNKQ